MEKLQIKQCLDHAMKWLEEEPSEQASIAGKMCNVNPSSIRSRLLRMRHQEQNSHGTLNLHGGKNLILTDAQEQAVYRFCPEQVEIGMGATPSIIYAAICHLRQQQKCNRPSLRWFQLWLKNNAHLHSIKTKPIARVRVSTLSKEDLKSFVDEDQNSLVKLGIKRAKYIWMNLVSELDVLLGRLS